MPTNPSPETLRDWEVIQENVGVDKTERLRIQQGWLYRTVVGEKAVALIFIPSLIGDRTIE